MLEYFEDSKGVGCPYDIKDNGSEGQMVLFELWEEQSQHIC